MAWIDANGVSLRYALSGTGAQVLVLLHEMGGCLESWDGVIPWLEPHFRVLRFDMRGAGLSEKRRSVFSIDDLTADLTALLDALGVDGPVLLAGCAVGAATALRLAAHAPERVAAVVALAPATGLAQDKKAATLALAAQLESEGLRERVLLRFDHSYPAQYFATPESRNQVLGRLLSHDPFTYAATYRMLTALDMEADLPRIRCPVLVVAGQQDATRPPLALERVAQSIPGAAFQVIDSGHAMPILSPQATARALLGFLVRDAARPPG